MSIAYYIALPFFIGSFLDVAAEEQRVNLRVGGLMQLATEANVDFWADETRCLRIVQFQDRAAQTREIIDFYRNTLGMAYKTMFPRNPQPEKFTDLMEKIQECTGYSWLCEGADDCWGEICSYLA